MANIEKEKRLSKNKYFLIISSAILVVLLIAVSTYVFFFTNKDDAKNDPVVDTYAQPTYQWSGDYLSCIAKKECINDSSKTITENGKVTTEVTQNKTCFEGELSKFTATFTNTNFTTQVKSDIQTALPFGNGVHDYILYNTVKETCTTDGYQIFKCKHCDDEIKMNVVTAHHSFEEVEKDEGKDGHVVYPEIQTEDYCYELVMQECAGCGEVISTKIGHTFIKTVKTPATCEENSGVYEYKCTDCGFSYTENYTDPNAHVWDSGDENDGVITYSCTKCTAQKQAISFKDNVSATVDVSKLSDTELELKEASIKLDSDTLNALGEDVTISADTLDSGARDEAISNLSPEEQERIGNSVIYDFNMESNGGAVSEFGGKVLIRIPYTPSADEDVDAIVIWYLSDSGEVEPKDAVYCGGFVEFETNHFSYYTVTRLTPAERCALHGHYDTVSEASATCESDGFKITFCTRCGRYERIDYPAIGHDFGVISETPATCTQRGSQVKKCAHCEKTQNLVIPALGHNLVVTETVASTCTVHGSVTKKCDRCNETFKEVLPLKEHTYKVTVVPCTSTTDGYTLHECEVCGYNYKDDIVPKGSVIGEFRYSDILTALSHILDDGISLKIDNFKIDIDETAHNIDENTEITINDCRLWVDLDENDNIIGYFVLDADNIRSWVIDNITPSLDGKEQIVGVIKDGKIYISAVMDNIHASYGMSSSNVIRFIDMYVSSSNFLTVMDLSELAELVPFTVADGSTSDILSGVLNIIANKNGEMTQVKEKVSQLIGSLKGLINENSEELSAVADKILGAVFEIEEQPNGYVVKISKDKLFALNSKLNTLKVSEIVDDIVGAGTYAKLPDYISALYDLTISDVLDFLNDKLDVTVDDICSLIDELKSMVDIPIDSEQVKMMLADQEIINMPLGDIVLSTVGLQLEKADVIEMVKGIIEEFGDYTLYGLIEMMALESDTEGEAVFQMVNGFIEEFTKNFKLEMEFSVSKALKSISTCFEITSDSSYRSSVEHIEFTIKAEKDDYDYQKAIEEISEKYDEVDVQKIIDYYVKESDGNVKYNSQENTLIWTSTKGSCGEILQLGYYDVSATKKYTLYLDTMLINIDEECVIRNVNYEIKGKVETESNCTFTDDEDNAITFEEMSDRVRSYIIALFELKGVTEDKFEGGLEIGYEWESLAELLEMDYGFFYNNILNNTFTFDEFIDVLIEGVFNCKGIVQSETEYTVYSDSITLSRSGEILGEYYAHQNTRTEFSFLDDENCEHGVMFTKYCEDCGELVGYTVTYEHNQALYESEEERISLRKYGAPNGCNLVIRSCPCGELKEVYMEGPERDFTYCNRAFDEENKCYYDVYKVRQGDFKYAVCNRSDGCKIYRDYLIGCDINGKHAKYTYSYISEYDHNYQITKIIKEAEGCEGVGIKELTCIVCGDVKTENYINGHKIGYEYELLDGESCDNGVKITEYCKDCGERFGYYTTYWHERFEKAKIDLSQYGCTCETYLVIEECACGKEKYVRVEGECDFGYNYVYDEENDCDIYVYTCAVTDPQCAFRYAVRYRHEKCTEYRDYLIGCDENGKNAKYIYTETCGTDHNISWSNEPTGTTCYYHIVGECINCGETFDHGYGYIHSNVHEECTPTGTPCYFHIERVCDDCLEVFDEWEEWHHEEGEHVRIEETCTQFGKDYYICPEGHEFHYVYGTQENGTGIIRPLQHFWEYDYDKCTYVCFYCGLENSNGADGDVILEDCTEDYSGDDIVIGFYSERLAYKYVVNDLYDAQKYYGDMFNPAVTLILDEANEDGDDQVDVEGLEITYSDNGTDYNNYLIFSKSDVINFATQQGYTEGSYDIRLSFVPIGGSQDLDYAITITRDNFLK